MESDGDPTVASVQEKLSVVTISPSSTSTNPPFTFPHTPGPQATNPASPTPMATSPTANSGPLNVIHPTPAAAAAFSMPVATTSYASASTASSAATPPTNPTPSASSAAAGPPPIDRVVSPASLPPPSLFYNKIEQYSQLYMGRRHVPPPKLRKIAWLRARLQDLDKDIRTLHACQSSAELFDIHQRLCKFYQHIVSELEEGCAGRYIKKRTIRITLFGKAQIVRDTWHPERIYYFQKKSEISLFQDPNKRHKEEPVKEIEIMALLATPGHPAILRMEDEYEYNGFRHLVCPLYQDGELLDLLNRRRLTEDEARFVYRQLVLGVQYMHGKGICHLDISAENVLVSFLPNSPNIQPVLCDFGMACRLPADHMFPGVPLGHGPGKLQYKAPEIHNGQPYNGVRADVYSLGIILYILLTSRPPYGDRGPTSLSHGFDEFYLEGIFDMYGLVSPDAVDLIRHTACQPHQRLSIEQILMHRWLNPS